jgi:ABC-2 type transport system ATP-binding protein
MNFDPAISVIDLRKKYKGSEDEALKGINLTIVQGEFLGLLGPNAAGKSTLIAILCGITDQSSGQVIISGHNISSDKNSLKKRIGLVPQEIALYPSLTVLENLQFFGRMHGLSACTLKSKIDECIDVFRLGEHRKKLISKCSGGIKRRVNLFAGVIHDPDLILLDEPTLGVDAQLRSVIFDYVAGLNKKGATIIYTTHYMKEAETLCSRVGIIDHGLIIKEGTPAELIAEMPDCPDLGHVFLNLTGRDLRD